MSGRMGADEERRPSTTTDRARPMCECCTPARPLALRADFGLMADGSPRYAICVTREPFVVHVNRGDGTYEKRDDLTLSADGNTINGPSGPVASSARTKPSGGLQGGNAMIGGSRPSTTTGERVDLTQDEHYGRAGRLS